METKSGEEDEEILFKERTKLFRWDREISQWKERGVGDIKILFHPTKHSYRVLMRREQVLRVCANHTITQSMELKPMNTSTNALIWTATDYAGKAGGAVQNATLSPSRAEVPAVPSWEPLGSKHARLRRFIPGLLDCAITQYLCVFQESNSHIKTSNHPNCLSRQTDGGLYQSLLGFRHSVYKFNSVGLI